ncbi:MAG: 2-oxo-hepta-3-ene-1,7-dioic acid hydratase [Rhodobacteraceae bacterium]|nr:2-oxo-hepta-3-ene-1,7-dioic acid hydratase [Paracoccaceae bacterium]
MTLSVGEIEQAGEDLFQAERKRRQIGLLSLRHPGMTLQDAYAVQTAFTDRKKAGGGVVRGWKIGLTSKAMQDVLKIETPDSGILFDDMLFDSGGTIPQDRFIEPRIEAEIAFVMQDDLAGGDVDRNGVLAATEFVFPALEILDTRILRKDPETGDLRKIVDTIADNAANAGVVLGGMRHDPAGTDLRWTGAIVSRNGEVEETGLGAGVLNDPVMGIVWLARRLAQFDQGLRAGDVVLSGSFIRPIEASRGSKIHADFGPFGHVSCHFG